MLNGRVQTFHQRWHIAENTSLDNNANKYISTLQKYDTLILQKCPIETFTGKFCVIIAI